MTSHAVRIDVRSLGVAVVINPGGAGRAGEAGRGSAGSGSEGSDSEGSGSGSEGLGSAGSALVNPSVRLCAMETRKRPREEPQCEADCVRTPHKPTETWQPGDFQLWDTRETCSYLRHHGLGQWERKFRGNSAHCAADCTMFMLLKKFHPSYFYAYPFSDTCSTHVRIFIRQ